MKFVFRIFEPFFLAKYRSTKIFLTGLLEATWYDFIPILFLPYLTQLVESGKKEEALTVLIYISAFSVICWIINYFARSWDAEGKSYLEIALNEKYRKSIIIKDPQFIDKIGTGKVQSILQKGFFAWINVVWSFIYQIARVLVGIFVGVYLTLQMGYSFFFLFIILSIVSFSGFTYFKIKQIEYKKQMNNIGDELSKNYIRLIMSRQEVLFSNSIEKEIKKIKEYIHQILKKIPHYSKLDFISDLFVSSLTIVLPVLGAIFVIYSTDISANTGVYLSLIYFSSRFTGIMYWLVWMVNQIVDNYPELKKFWDFLEYIPEMKNYDNGKSFEKKNGQIIFENVTFTYAEKKNKFFDTYDLKDEDGEEEVGEDIEEIKEEKNILENFNLKIEGGQKIALIGKSGSGKTTIAKLISGLINPSAGKVKIDGQNLQEVSLKSYYNYLGYLTQDPGVFDGSIKENLLYAIKRKVKEEEIYAALDKAHCDFVYNLKLKLNTEIGEKGIRLSGGERQRLAIAKLFLKNPEIILLDEPTSALDSFSEEKITQSLEELFKGRTTIIIAHRLQTVISADRILVLENGKIIEEGNHEYLVEKNGVYAKMLAMQSGF